MIVKHTRTLLDSNMSSKHKDLILMAVKLFHRYGFSKVSVEEICREARVSKVTFYRYYKSKDELIVSILTLLFDDITRRVWALLEGDKSLKQKFDKIAVMKLEFTRMLGEEIFAALFAYPAVQAYHKELSRKSIEDFKIFMYRERERGNINSRLNIELLMALLNELAGIIQKPEIRNTCKGNLDLISQLNEILIYGIFSREQ